LKSRQILEQLGLSAAEIERLRHSASIQSMSDGRLVLSIGRGGSSLAYVRSAPSSVGALERYVSVVRHYLHRQYVAFEDLEEYGRGADLPPAEELHLSNNVGASRLEWWLSDAQTPPPIDVAGAGPRVIAVGGREADGVCLAVGADVDRIRWGIAIARDARADAHRNEELGIGAYITVACHTNESVALDLVRGTLAVFARFSIMHGKSAGPLSQAQETTLAGLAGRYDMAEHSKGSSTRAGTIDLDFARQYSVIGPPERCISRLSELVDAGVTRLVLVRPEPNVPLHLASPEAQRAQNLLANEVLPASRR
jgi:5,10-methylenetetrahydromethanopterin reductase